MEETSAKQVCKLFVKGMICSCCIDKVRQLLKENEINPLSVGLGEIVLMNCSGKKLGIIEELLNANGFEVLKHKESKLVEQIKTAVVELIHHANYSNSLIRNSDYLVDKLGYSYPHLSGVFSRHEKYTLEKFIILHKIEKVKELITYDELSLSEIASILAYSSVQYLSNQFKSIEGITVSEYKAGKGSRKPLNEI